MTLQERWCDLWGRLGAQGDRDARLEHLRGLYSEPVRAYHTLEHIEACFRAFDEARHLSTRPEEVEYGIWFHDAVYDPRRLDNEEESARLACEVASEIGKDQAFATRVSDMILATKHQSLPKVADACLIVDCDLSGLALPFDAFRRNTELVRREYAWQSDEEFNKDLTALFRLFLDRPSVYRTGFFRSNYEQRARENMERTLSMM